MLLFPPYIGAAVPSAKSPSVASLSWSLTEPLSLPDAPHQLRRGCPDSVSPYTNDSHAMFLQVLRESIATEESTS
ncbi:hypothetical protein NL676_002963 [Syzygium grande]|nr:hypothetical protein NL676_002963 [Syzygium grande]